MEINMLEFIQTLATAFLTITAFLGLKQWKTEIRGKDQYKALIQIKVKFLNFQTLYQNQRLNIIHQIHKNLTEDEHATLKKIYDEYFKRLWLSYNKLTQAINYFHVINTTEKYFLSEELQEIYNFIGDYTTSSNIYYENKAGIRKSNDETLQHCEKFLVKSSAESDEISHKLNKLIQKAFEKIDAKLKSSL